MTKLRQRDVGLRLLSPHEDLLRRVCPVRKALLTQCAQTEQPPNQRLPTPPPWPTRRVHLANVRQLTFGGDNAEAYWAFNNDALVYQTTQPQAGIPCDRIFVMPLDEEPRQTASESQLR